MIPTKGNYIKVIFRNAAQAEGYVESWTDKISVIKSEDGLNYFVIQKTEEDVMAIKIMLDSRENKSLPKIEEHLDIIHRKFQEEYEYPSDDDLRIKNLAQLKIAMIEQERKLAAAKLRDHTFSGIRKANYEHGFFQMPRTK